MVGIVIGEEDIVGVVGVIGVGVGVAVGVNIGGAG